jgi:hypothetical protein
VSHVHWYEVQDPGGPAGGFTGSGLYFGSGQPKPSTAAFRFPFVGVPSGRGNVTLWGRAPEPGLVTIEAAHGRAWRRMVRLTTTRGGVFYARRHLGAHLLLRARVGSVTSYPWSTG